MAFHSAKYETYVFLGDPEIPPIWNWQAWKQTLPALDPLMAIARGKPAVRSEQYPIEGKANAKVSFGRLAWKEADHHKWTHDSPVSQTASKSWLFFDVEIWAPAWTVCEREDLAPDIFLHVFNPDCYNVDGRKSEFNPVVVLAVNAILAERENAKVVAVVAALHQVLSAKLAVHKQRRWGVGFGGAGFTGSIQELVVDVGMHNSGDVGVHLLNAKWQPVSADGSASR